MRRAAAPMTHACRRGGIKDKARIGLSSEKVTNTGRGGRFHPFAPVAQLHRAPGSYPEGAGWIPAGGTFNFS